MTSAVVAVAVSWTARSNWSLRPRSEVPNPKKEFPLCTDFVINVGKAGSVNGRSMEFAETLHSKLFFRAPNHAYDQRLSGPEFGFTWKGRYGFVGMNVFDFPICVDGINSMGLATGALWLPGTQYQTISQVSRGLSIDNFTDWVLSSFATCEEVWDALKHGVVQVGFPKLLSSLLPLHFPVHDAKGNSIVIEFLEGRIHIQDNPIGVLTNDPPFAWHLQNLRNFVGISPWDREPMQLGELSLNQTGHGSGLAQLPGDPTPPSRFVRTTMMVKNAFPAEDLDDATNLCFHVLNTVDIPQGTARFRARSGHTISDHTQWAVVKDLARKIYSVRYYHSPQVFSVELDGVRLDEMNGKQFKVPKRPNSIDLTAEVKETKPFDD